VSTVSENDVEAEIIGFLVKRGWIIRRQHSCLVRSLSGHKIRLGELGQCDWSAMRPQGEDRKVEFLEIEAKRPGEKPSKVQREYIAKRLHQGISATWADSLALFERWYFMEGFE
jgi:hypothetical protein